MSEQPENYPRETGSEIPDGAVMREDGSYVQPNKTANIQSATHDEAGNLIVTEEQEALLAEQLEAERAAVNDGQLRETGTDVTATDRELASQQGDDL